MSRTAIACTLLDAHSPLPPGRTRNRSSPLLGSPHAGATSPVTQNNVTRVWCEAVFCLVCAWMNKLCCEAPAVMSDKKGHGAHAAHEPAVHPIELFSDLVFVVALNVVARLFEESAEFWHGLWLYALRIFLLTGALYQQMSGVSTFVGLFGGGFRPSHFVAMFMWMGAILFMVRAFESSEHRASIAWFCFAYFLAGFLTIRELTRPKPPEMSDAVYGFFQMLSRVIVPVVSPIVLLLPVVAGGFFMEVSAARVRAPLLSAVAAALC